MPRHHPARLNRHPSDNAQPIVRHFIGRGLQLRELTANTITDPIPRTTATAAYMAVMA
jgi:hypothetical protein